MTETVANASSQIANAGSLGRIPVIIPTLNEASHIGDVIRSLDEPGRVGCGYRFLIVDGGSRDGTVSEALSLKAEGYDIEVIHNPARRQGAAINLAVAQLDSTASVFVRCDAHGEYPEGYVRRLVETLDRQGADSVVVSMDSVGAKCLQKAIAWLSNSSLGTGGSAHRAGRKSGWVSHGHHAAFKTRWFKAVGGYDQGLAANEDGELDARMIKAGARVYLDTDIRMIYYPRSSLGGLATQYYRYGYGRAFTALKHPDSIRLRQFAVPCNFLCLVGCLALAPFWPATLAWPLLYVLILAAAAVAIAAQRRSLCGLWCGPAALVMHNAWGFGFLHRIAAITVKRTYKLLTGSAYNARQAPRDRAESGAGAPAPSLDKD